MDLITRQTKCLSTEKKAKKRKGVRWAQSLEGMRFRREEEQKSTVGEEEREQ